MRIYVKVIPRSSLNKIEKLSEGDYKVHLTAPPLDNKANLMLIKMLSEYFDKPKSSFSIAGGRTARIKIVDIL